MALVTVTITDLSDTGSASGLPSTVVVSSGTGEIGPQGPAGPTGPTGATGAAGTNGTNGTNGATGAAGADGEGVPVGGTTAQVLAKASDTDFDTEWVDQTGGGGGAVDSVNGQTGVVVLDASDVGADASGAASTALTTAEAYTDTAVSGLVPNTRTVAGHALSANVTVSKSDVGLGNVDNTADASKSFTASQVSDSTTVGRAVVTAVDAAAGRTAIGAGTSSLALGTSSSTAKVGDYQPASTNISDATTVGKAVLTGTDAAAVRTTLGLGTAATISSTAGGDLSGTLPSPTVTKLNGTALSGLATGLLKNTTGTGVPSIAVAADIPNIAESQVTNLTTDLAAKQPLDSDLTTIAGLTATTDNFIQAKSSAWASRTPAQVAADLALPVAAVGRSINTQTGTTYTLVLTDGGKFVTMNNASASTLTVPPNSSVAFPTGSFVEGVQLGAGQVTLTAGAGVTIRNTPGLKIAAQYGTFGLLKIGTDEWVAMGRLSA